MVKRLTKKFLLITIVLSVSILTVVYCSCMWFIILRYLLFSQWNTNKISLMYRKSAKMFITGNIDDVGSNNFENKEPLDCSGHKLWSRYVEYNCAVTFNFEFDFDWVSLRKAKWRWKVVPLTQNSCTTSSTLITTVPHSLNNIWFDFESIVTTTIDANFYKAK